MNALSRGKQIEVIAALCEGVGTLQRSRCMSHTTISAAFMKPFARHQRRRWAWLTRLGALPSLWMRRLPLRPPCRLKLRQIGGESSR